MTDVLRRAIAPLILLAALAVAGCSGTLGIEPIIAAQQGAGGGGAQETELSEQHMIGEPYKVGGRWFTPKDEPDYDETGLASWYGPGFQGNRTANGERFDRNALTGAHPTLPLPSFVKVTNTDTGDVAVVRINDRGPFHRGRIIDVSEAAAKELGFRGKGSAKVRVEYLGPAPIGGGDAETLMAAAQHGIGDAPAAEERGGFGIARLNPFGRTKDRPAEERDVEVRLASAEPTVGEPLPGVTPPVSRLTAVAARAPEVESAPAEEPLEDPVTAYRDAGEGSIDALLALQEAEEEAAPEPLAAEAPQPETARAPAPLPAVESAPADSRVASAHDLFDAIDSASGGAGELNGIDRPE